MKNNYYNAQFHFELAMRIIAEEGSWNYALEALSRSIELDDSNFLVYLKRVQCNLFLRRFDEAFDDIEQAIQLEPNYSQSYEMRGLLLVEDLEKFNPRTGILEPHLKANREAAFIDFSRAAELGSQNPATYFWLGMIYSNRDALPKAIQCYDKAIELKPNFPLAYASRAQLKGEIGDLAGQKADKQKLIDLCS